MTEEIVLSESQEAACKAFRKWLRNPDSMEFLLSGFAGSGKSFLVSYLIDFVRDEFRLLRIIDRTAKPVNFHFTATTNKAANVLSNMMQAPAKTIHQALGLVVRNERHGGGVYLEQKNDPVSLNHSVLVIDEASMINRDLLEIIRKTARKHKDCKILYVGDSYQLPPVKENTCPIFSRDEDVYFLTDIQRQAADSPIISFSHKYREILDFPETPWPEIPNNGDTILHYTDPKEWQKALKGAYLNPHEVDDVRCLAWSNKRVRGYNDWIRKQMGFTRPFEDGEMLLCNSAIVLNDRIRARTDSLHEVVDSHPVSLHNIAGHHVKLCSVDTHEFLSVFQPMNWDEANQLISSLANKAKAARQRGDRAASGELWAKFWEIKNGWGDFRPVHAQTVHKSQGSTYREVFIDLADIATNNKWYEVARLMYVAVTRASHRVHLYGKLAERYVRKDPMALMEAFRDGDNKSTYT